MEATESEYVWPLLARVRTVLVLDLSGAGPDRDILISAPINAFAGCHVPTTDGTGSCSTINMRCIWRVSSVFSCAIPKWSLLNLVLRYVMVCNGM